MKKVYVVSVQPDPNGPTFGRVMDPNDFQKSQNYAHVHIDQVVRDLLVAGAANAQLAGFLATVAGGLNVSVAQGTVVDNQGVSYETNPAATVVALAAADQVLPRIDLIYATLEIDVPAVLEFRAFRRLRTQAELAAGTPEYPPTQFNQPTELHTRATIAVRTGVPNANPVPPAVGANEVTLWRVHVAAGQQNLTNGDLTDVRALMKSLFQVLLDVVALQAQMAALTETVQDIVGVFIHEGPGVDVVYDDTNNTFTVSLEPALKALLDNATNVNNANTLAKRDSNGNFHAGPLSLNQVSAPVGGSSQPGVAALGTTTNTEEVVLSLGKKIGAGVSVGGGKFSVEGNVAQNNCIIRFYNNRGGNPNSDKLRYMNDELGRHFIYGVVNIRTDVDGLGGSLDVQGSFTAGAKNFEIDHPLDPLNKNLRFSTTESPNWGIECWGKTILVAGAKVVDIDAALGLTSGTFVALFDDVHVFLQNETGFGRVKYGLVNNQLGIMCDDSTSTDTVHWQIKGRRKDELVKYLPQSDVNGHLLVESNKPVGVAGAASAANKFVRAAQPAPDHVDQEVVFSLIGTVGYPLHATLAPSLGPVPTRQVTVKTVDMDGKAFKGD